MPPLPEKFSVDGLLSGNPRALARAITMAENDGAAAADLLAALPWSGSARVVGITGPPGAGKSTLTDALTGHWVAQGKRVCVLAVDPSSPFHFGALLGDRIRMSRWYTHPNVFIRSLASRGALGGLHPRILEVTDVAKSAGFDVIIIETVGVGQSEVDIAGLADCTVVTLVPEAGDMVQTMKAGLMEVADVFAVNKADREGAEAIYRALRAMAHEQAPVGEEEIPVLKCAATSGEGIAALAKAVEHRLQATGTGERKLLMLAARAYRLIAESRMNDISQTALRAQLALVWNQPGFNLYAFAAHYAAGQTTADPA